MDLDLKTAFSRLRTLLVASDPSLARLRMASRVTLTLIAIVGVLLLVRAFLPLSVAAYGVAVITAMQGALQIKDATNGGRIITRLYCGLGGFAAAALASGLSSWPIMADSTFLLLVFGAVYARKYGVRWNAVGMFAFMCYFIGSYLRPSPADLPGVAISIALAGGVAHLIRISVLPERPSDEFERATIAIFERIDDLSGILRNARHHGWTSSRRRDSFRAQDRIGEALLIADSYLPIGDENLSSEDPGKRMAIELFDLHLASETAMLAALADEGTRDDARKSADDPAAIALARLARLADAARKAARHLPSNVFERSPDMKPPARADGKRHRFLRDPALRLAVQVSLASAIAMTGGLLVSKTRWFWAILTAFLVFVNTQSRGDTAVRAFNRAVGTFGGILIGIALATLLHAAFLPSAILIVVFTFVGFYLLQLSYGAMTFCVTIVLSLLYGLLGEFTPGLLVLRLEETLIGTLAGVFISFAVFPQKTEAAAHKAAEAYLSALDRVLAAAAMSIEKGRKGTSILALARHLDRRLADLAVAARPLGGNWWIVRRPGSVRQTLLRFTALTYWTRSFAKDIGSASLDPPSQARLRQSIEALRARIAAARGTGVRFFKESDGAAATNAAGLPRFSEAGAETDDPLLALDTMARLVARIAPDPATVDRQ